MSTVNIEKNIVQQLFESLIYIADNLNRKDSFFPWVCIIF